ncbi:MAG TPA: malectin domain-containing carbohydrate-binding protein [Kofleriaceae bacterium]|nr:malectin domain-containing carbohydrate-binding protein [Kofleriaceae bacterium]
MGRSVAPVVVVFAVGCYAPQIHEGVPCGDNNTCPNEQRCIGGFCVVPGPADATPGDGERDSASDGRRPIDGSPDGPLAAIRIDVDGMAYTGVDYPGAWAADPGTSGICDGSPFASPTSTVNGTNDSTLFVGQMFNGTLTCKIPSVPPGTYQVTMLFAELRLGASPCTAPSPPSRIFDIALEGTTVATNFNMTSTGGGCAATGGPGRAFSETYTIDVTDGELDVVETASQGAAVLNAIELVQQ